MMYSLIKGATALPNVIYIIALLWNIIYKLADLLNHDANYNDKMREHPNSFILCTFQFKLILINGSLLNHLVLFLLIVADLKRRKWKCLIWLIHLMVYTKFHQVFSKHKQPTLRIISIIAQLYNLISNASILCHSILGFLHFSSQYKIMLTKFSIPTTFFKICTIYLHLFIYNRQLSKCYIFLSYQTGISEEIWLTVIICGLITYYSLCYDYVIFMFFCEHALRPCVELVSVFL